MLKLLGIATSDLTNSSLFSEIMLLAKLVPKINQMIKIYLFLDTMIYLMHLMSDLYLWKGKDKFFLKCSIVCIALLIGIHIYFSATLFDSSSKTFELLHIMIILILLVMFLAILLKGIVPVAISCLGLVLLYGSIFTPAANCLAADFDGDGVADEFKVTREAEKVAKDAGVRVANPWQAEKSSGKSSLK